MLIKDHKCSIPGCERNARMTGHGRIVCVMHYNRWRRNGSFELNGRAFSGIEAQCAAVLADGPLTLVSVGGIGEYRSPGKRVAFHGKTVAKVIEAGQAIRIGKSVIHIEHAAAVSKALADVADTAFVNGITVGECREARRALSQSNTSGGGNG